MTVFDEFNFYATFVRYFTNYEHQSYDSFRQTSVPFRQASKNGQVCQSDGTSHPNIRFGVALQAILLLQRRFNRSAAHREIHPFTTPQRAQRCRPHSRRNQSAPHQILPQQRKLGGSQSAFGALFRKQPNRYNQILQIKMDIKILGTGCSKCKTLEKHTREAVESLNIQANITKVEDIMEIIQFGVMTTPALVVNGKVEIKGRIPSVEEIKTILNQ